MQSQLVGVHHIEATKSAFAAITVQAGVQTSESGNGASVSVTLKSSVVTWGDQLHGGNCADVQNQLEDIVQLKATKFLDPVLIRFFLLQALSPTKPTSQGLPPFHVAWMLHPGMPLPP